MTAELELALELAREAVVEFEETSDLFFFDMADRRGLRPTLEEGCAYDEEVEQGATEMTLEQWLRMRRSSPQA